VRRRVLGASAIALALLAIVLLWGVRSPYGRGSEVSRRAAPAPRFAHLRPAPPELPGPSDDGVPAADGRDKPFSAMPPAGARDYLTLYKGLSTRLNPALAPHESFPTTRIESGKSPRLVIWTVSNRTVVGDSARVHALLLDDKGERVWPVTAAIHLFPAGRPAEGYSTLMKPTPDDPAAMFAWAFHADPAKFPAFGSGGKTRAPVMYGVFVHMEGTWEGKPFVRDAQGGFFVESPGASLDAERIAISRTQEDLVVSVHVQIERAGRYWAGAELWGGPGGTIPLALAQRPLGDLPAGPSTVELVFGGQILRDAGVDGPYTIRSIHLNQMDTVPPHQAPAIDEVKTPAFRASEFGRT
jgi:hypothetical protein